MLFNEQYKTLKTFTLWPRKTKETNSQFTIYVCTNHTTEAQETGKNHYFVRIHKCMYVACEMESRLLWTVE